MRVYCPTVLLHRKDSFYKMLSTISGSVVRIAMEIGKMSICITFVVFYGNVCYSESRARMVYLLGLTWFGKVVRQCSLLSLQSTPVIRYSSSPL